MKVLTTLSVSIVVCLIFSAISIGKDIRIQATKKELDVAAVKSKSQIEGKKITLAAVKPKIRRF